MRFKNFTVLYSIFATAYIVLYLSLGLVKPAMLLKWSCQIWLLFLGLMMMFPKIFSPKLDEKEFENVNLRFSRVKSVAMQNAMKILFLFSASKNNEYNKKLGTFYNILFAVGFTVLLLTVMHITWK